MINSLMLVASKDLNGNVLDCYVEPEQEDTGAFWATRGQIGRLLEYENPRDAIYRIHERHQDRLDKFSRGDKLCRRMTKQGEK